MTLVLMKTDTKNKEFMTSLNNLNNKVLKMISNACKAVMASEEKKEEVINYALIIFLHLSDTFEVSFENFKTVVHLYFISICNGFGIADDQMLRIGTGIYYPSVSVVSKNNYTELSEPLMRT